MEKIKKNILEKHGYYLTGDESAVKLCHWVSEKLINGRACYKEKFYGIESHRCIQMSPVVDGCNHSCLFCWRYQDFIPRSPDSYDEPEDIVERSLSAQRALVSGFKGDERCDSKMWKEARKPNQVAISLAGEPTMYPYLSDLIEEYKKRGMTTFLVTNGTHPEIIESLDELPTQIYVTIAAPNKKIYNKLCVPSVRDGWERLNKTLELFPSLDIRTAVRHTLVKGWNLGWEKEYADMIKKAEPDFVEAKGYVFVGDSRRRMGLSNMPSHGSVKEFAHRLEKELDIRVVDEKKDSRVVLLSDPEKETIIKR